MAVLNDGRYGHAVFDGAVRVSLARAARYPDPEPDQGRHEVTIGLLPHGAGLADVVAEAERLDLPVRASPVARRRRAPSPIVTVTGAGVEVDAVKLADDGSGDVIVRLHEACGDRQRVTVAADRRITAAGALRPAGGSDRRLRGERRHRGRHPASVRAADAAAHTVRMGAMSTYCEPRPETESPGPRKIAVRTPENRAQPPDGLALVDQVGRRLARVELVVGPVGLLVGLPLVERRHALGEVGDRRHDGRLDGVDRPASWAANCSVASSRMLVTTRWCWVAR